MRFPIQAAGTVKVRRYQEKALYCITPEIADSMGNGTRISLDRVCPVGTGSLVAPGWNCQTPFKLSQLERTSCGRGYSGRGLLVSISGSQRVMSGPCFICQAIDFAGVSRRTRTTARASLQYFI